MCGEPSFDEPSRKARRGDVIGKPSRFMHTLKRLRETRKPAAVPAARGRRKFARKFGSRENGRFEGIEAKGGTSTSARSQLSCDFRLAVLRLFGFFGLAEANKSSAKLSKVKCGKRDAVHIQSTPGRLLHGTTSQGREGSRGERGNVEAEAKEASRAEASMLTDSANTTTFRRHQPNDAPSTEGRAINRERPHRRAYDSR
ncbi:hypothetical protein C8F04DRAFT_1172976 [Mycena alexandri]|uniref:Uncharacterized protein n=1 Tax=Mycena alexandri TaxID=1745969 RepID=A0AAD6TIM8_9AGAR|nr:hypothetical protein C8F04DRAFT_1172976 [Mycena alexandri]